jgi:hypothetical protein
VVVVVVNLILAVSIVFASQAVPSGQVDSSQVAAAATVTVGPGAGGSVFFPFQATASAGTSGGTNAAVVNVSVSGSVAEIACGGAATCPGLLVEIMTPAQLHQYELGGTAPAVWCLPSGNACTGIARGSFATTLDRDAGARYELVLIDPSTSGPVVTATVTATLFWTA